MKNRRSSSAYPVVAVTRQDMMSLYALALRGWEGEESKEAVAIKAILKDGQTFETFEIEKIFDVPNYSSNPIDTIKLSSESYKQKRVSITLGGSVLNVEGASIEVSGDAAFTGSCIDEFTKIVKKEKSIPEIIASARPYTYTFFIVLVFSVILYFDSRRASFGGKVESFSDSIINIFFAVTVSISFIVYMQYRFFGKAAFVWGDGETRYKRNLGVLKFLILVVPFTIAAGVIVNKIS